MSRYLTHDGVISSFKNIHGDKYNYDNVSYVDNLSKVEIICPIHGSFFQIPKSHKRGHGCSKCSKNFTWNGDHIINQFNEIHNNVYDYTKMDYLNDRDKIDIICNKHGIFKQSPNNHKKGKGCPKCGDKSSSKKQSMGIDEFIKKSNKIHNNYYTYPNSKYVNNSTNLIITCTVHGDFQQQPINHLNNKGCPKCKMSKGEKKIEEILKEKNIKYSTQKTFNDLKSDKNKYLKFDFYLPNLNLCIEYNGKQHYESVKWFGGDKSFNRRQYLDGLKRKYCDINNINLLEISYLDLSNIRKILNNI